MHAASSLLASYKSPISHPLLENKIQVDVSRTSLEIEAETRLLPDTEHVRKGGRCKSHVLV